MKKRTREEELFMSCIDELNVPIGQLSNKYRLEVMNSSLIELGLRMAMIQGGTFYSIRVFSNIMDNLATFGQMIEKDLQAMASEGHKPDPFEDWKYSNATKKTIH